MTITDMILDTATQALLDLALTRTRDFLSEHRDPATLNISAGGRWGNNGFVVSRTAAQRGKSLLARANVLILNTQSAQTISALDAALGELCNVMANLGYETTRDARADSLRAVATLISGQRSR